MSKVIHLPPANAVTGRSSNPYKEYAVLKKNGSYDKWIKKQYAKQAARCVYCMESLKNKRLNIEHVVPKSRGGQNKTSNLVVSCAMCNKEKGSRAASRKLIQRNLAKLNKIRKQELREYHHKRKVDADIARKIKERL
jgi:5-methylcytosine-specific restriction endonuclease McrA